MASSTESIGRLIADEVFLLSDRQLLQKRQQSPQQPDDQPAQAPSAPISHNDKAMASVLMTLIDEQIDASAVGPGGTAGDPAAAQSRSVDGSGVPNRIAAQYAEDAAVYRSDSAPQPIVPNPLGRADPQVLLAASSPELRMAMQATLMSAAARVQAVGSETIREDAQRHKISGGPDASSMIRMGAGILVAIIAAIVLATHFVG
ncbi:MAG: hypothetical protein JSR99_18450 [Proteobacteria bacterium]|nr:hypothetical protein [Pseudomonadota bacterium]